MRPLRRWLFPLAVFLAIEFVDELVFGVREAAWPSIRGDLGLSYASIGVLLTVPGLVSVIVEPGLALTTGYRKRPLVIGAGGIAFILGLVLFAAAHNFVFLLIAFVILYPASGAFVSLTQATLMDSDSSSHEINMARWVLAGSVGVVVGPLAVALATQTALGWRPLLLGCAVISLPLAGASLTAPDRAPPAAQSLRASVRIALAALRNGRVVRWLALLQVTDLLGDVLAGFVALYFVDVVHVGLTTAALAVLVWTLAGLVGDLLLVPLLNRVSGLAYLRLSGLAMTVAYPAFLLAPSLGVKLALLAAVGLLRAGWYAIPQGRLYSDLHDDSNVVVALSSVGGLIGGIFPMFLGLAAEQWGLEVAMWLCAIAPLALLVGMPHGKPSQSEIS